MYFIYQWHLHLFANLSLIINSFTFAGAFSLTRPSMRTKEVRPRNKREGPAIQTRNISNKISVNDAQFIKKKTTQN